MQYKLPTTTRSFGRRVIGLRTVAIFAVVLIGAADLVRAEETRSLYSPPELNEVPPAWNQPPGAEPASSVSPRQSAQSAPSPGYFSGLAREPDEMLVAPAENPVHLASFSRNLNSYQPGQEDQPPGEPIGQAPADTSRVFLRSVTVLLQPGQIQFDWGAEYVLQKMTAPGLALVNQEVVVFEQELRDRRLLIPFAARLGIAPRVQAFVRAPIGWTQAEYASPFGEATDETFNIADVNAGVNLLLRDGQGQRADLIGTIGITAPTGKHPFEDQVATAAMGDGFWSIDASLLWIRSYDPVVVFWGVGYRHLFERDYLGFEIAPGEQITYNLGVGFAINDRITVSTAFIGQYVTETKYNQTYLPGSDQEPMSIRMALTTITSQNRVVEPFVRFGLTDDATDADFGVILTQSF